MRVRFFDTRRAVRFALPVALVIAVVVSIIASPKAMAAVQGAAAACGQTVRTVVTKLRKNTPTKATLARWAAWKVKHPDWHPSRNAKPRPRYVKTSTVGFRDTKLACEVGPAGKLTGTIVPVEESSLPDGNLSPVQMDDLMPSPVLVSSVKPPSSTGYVGPSYPPIFPSGGGGGGIGPGGGTALPPPVPELPSIFLTLTGILIGAMATFRRRRVQPQGLYVA